MTPSRLKHPFCFILFVLALSAPRFSALASCEGGEGGVVSTVWHSSEHDSYVIETQDAPAEDQDFRSYFIQEKNIRLPLASAFYIIWPNTPSDGSPMDRYRGKGEISFTFPAKDDSDSAFPPSAIFLRTLLASQKIPSKKIIETPSETKAAYQALVQSVENIIEHSGGYA